MRSRPTKYRSCIHVTALTSALSHCFSSMRRACRGTSWDLPSGHGSSRSTRASSLGPLGLVGVTSQGSSGAGRNSRRHRMTGTSTWHAVVVQVAAPTTAAHRPSVRTCRVACSALASVATRRTRSQSDIRVTTHDSYVCSSHDGHGSAFVYLLHPASSACSACLTAARDSSAPD